MMEVKAGQIWRSSSPSRPDMEVVRYNVYSQVVYWKHVDAKHHFETPYNMFIDQFTLKQDV